MAKILHVTMMLLLILTSYNIAYTSVLTDEDYIPIYYHVEGCLVNSTADWVLVINAKPYYIEGQPISIDLMIIRLGGRVKGIVYGLARYTCCSILYPNGTKAYDPNTYFRSFNATLYGREVSKGDVLVKFTWTPLIPSGDGKIKQWNPNLGIKSFALYIVKVNLDILERRDSTYVKRTFTVKFPIRIMNYTLSYSYPYNTIRIGVFLVGNWSIVLGSIRGEGIVKLTYIGEEPLKAKYVLHPLISHLEVVKVYDNGKSIVIKKPGYYVYNVTEVINLGTSSSMNFNIERSAKLLCVKGKLPDNITIKLYLPLKERIELIRRLPKYIDIVHSKILNSIGEWYIYIKRDHIISSNTEPKALIIFARVNETPVKIAYFTGLPLVAIDILYPNGSRAIRYLLPPGFITMRNISKEILWSFTWSPSTIVEPSRKTLNPGKYIMFIKLWVDEIIGKKSRSITYMEKHELIVVKDNYCAQEYIGVLYAGPWIIKLIYNEVYGKLEIILKYMGCVMLILEDGLTLNLQVNYLLEKQVKYTIKSNKTTMNPNETLTYNVRLQGYKPIELTLYAKLPEYGNIRVYLPIQFEAVEEEKQ